MCLGTWFAELTRPHAHAMQTQFERVSLCVQTLSLSIPVRGWVVSKCKPVFTGIAQVTLPSRKHGLCIRIISTDGSGSWQGANGVV